MKPGRTSANPKAPEAPHVNPKAGFVVTVPRSGFALPFPPTFFISFNSLENAWLNSKDEYEQEHVTPYFYRNPNHFKISVLKNPKDLSNFKWTVDTLDDFLFVQKIISKINKRPILISDILKIIDDI